MLVSLQPKRVSGLQRVQFHKSKKFISQYFNAITKENAKINLEL